MRPGRQPVFARWSERDNFVNNLDARVKLVLLLAFVVSIALLRAPSAVQIGGCLAVLVTAARAATLPIFRLLRASLLVLPFVGLFSILVYLSGDGKHAWYILAKSYLSALSVLIAISATPLSDLLAAARSFHIPAFVLQVAELIYRYLFVLSGEALTMQTAFHARAGRHGRRAAQASSGIIAVLFARSYSKAERIYHAMQARGLSENVNTSIFRRLALYDFVVLAAGLSLAVALHLL